MKLTNAQYDMLKKIALLIIPFSELIGKCGDALGYNLDPIVTILIAFDAFFGVLVTVLSHTYKPDLDEDDFE